MGQIVFVETLVAGFAPFGADLHDLDFVTGSGGLGLTEFAGHSGTARFISVELEGGSSFQGNSFLGAAHDGYLLTEFEIHDCYLSAGRMSTELAAASGEDRSAIAISPLNSGFEGDMLRAAGASTGAAQLVVATQPGWQCWRWPQSRKAPCRPSSRRATMARAGTPIW